jgi:hypothetical protein
METVREQWTDERLDDMKDQMRGGFERLDADLREVRTEMTKMGEGLRAEMKAEFAAVRAEMGANHRLQVQLSIGTIGTVVLCFLGLLVSHA